MRYVVVCDVWDEPTVIAEAQQRFNRSADRIVVLSPRRGAVESNGILRVPIRFKLEDAGLPNWRRKHWVRKAVSLAAGLRSARFFAGIEDIFRNIEAGDPDVIHLGKLGDFGRWLEAKCAQRFPDRRVITDTSGCSRCENVAGWRNYDPTALVSIVLPVWNGEKYLKYSIESCIAQTHQNFELIIVDDHSSDNTSAIIKKYATIDRRIRSIKNETNLGLPEALNVGFELSRGTFLTWTSDDNLYAATAIEYMVQQLCTFTEIGLVYCASYHIDETGNRIRLQIPLPPSALARENTINACFLYRRQVMDAVGPYRSAYRYIEDWDFFIRACLKFPAKSYLEPCYFYRIHGNSLTSAHSDEWKALSKKLCREHFGSEHNRILVPTLQQLVPNAVASALIHPEDFQARGDTRY
jgi:hypothetical protein